MAIAVNASDALVYSVFVFTGENERTGDMNRRITLAAVAVILAVFGLSQSQLPEAAGLVGTCLAEGRQAPMLIGTGSIRYAPAATDRPSKKHPNLLPALPTSEDCKIFPSVAFKSLQIFAAAATLPVVTIPSEINTSIR